MKKVIGVCLILFIISSVVFNPDNVIFKSYGLSETKEVYYDDVFSYDIWKHTNGSWQTTGYPGGSFSFNATKSVNVDADLKLKKINVDFLKVSSDDSWYDMSVKDASISSIVYNSSSVSFTVSGKLTANTSPIDIKKYSWQNENVEGYRYYIPVRITVVYEIVEDEIIDIEPEEPDEPQITDSDIPDSPEPEEPDEPGDDSEDVNYNVEADLLLPSEAYVGHRVRMQDCSVFSDGTDYYSPYKFYKEGLGSNHFDISEGPGKMSVYRLSKSSPSYYTDRYGVFSEPGEYNVQLTAKINGGYASTDIEAIDILPVPCVKVRVGGIQKENRKQILNITTAIDPEYPLNKMWVEIYENNSNKVHLDYYFDGRENVNDNSSLIKTRAIKENGSDDYYNRKQIEFLTKNEKEIELNYKVFVEDISGKSHETSGSFIVYPDDAPIAKIDVKKYNYREAGSNIAKINLKDVSDTLGDQVERVWKNKSDGKWTENFDYEDIEFGTGKSIIHEKNGVGKAEYSLTVKDIIPENETLIEYITSDDIKQNTAYVETEVVNVAPVVNLKAKPKQTADIIILTDSSNEANGKVIADNLSIKLGELGVTSNFYIQRLGGNYGESNEFGEAFTINTPFSYNAQWTSFESNNFISDSRKMYKIEADFGEYGGGLEKNEPYPKEPYKITAYDLENSEIVWEKQFESSIFNLGNKFSISQDDCEKYLYLCNGSNTVIIEKTDGNIIGTFNCKIEGMCYLNEKYIYCFGQNGITALSRKDGSIRIIDSNPISGKSIMLGNRINFLISINGVLNRGYFNPDNEAIEYSSLEGTASGYTGYDIDMYGNIAGVKLNGSYIYKIGIWDSTNSLIKEINANNYNRDCVIAKDENGKFSYAGFIFNQTKTLSGVYTYCIYLKTEGIFNSNSMTGKLYSKKGYKTNPSFAYGYSKGNTVYLITGSEYSYTFGEGTGDNVEKSCCFVFDFDNNTESSSMGSGIELGLNGKYTEYCHISDESIAMQITKGDPEDDGISGSVSRFLKCNKNSDWFLDYYCNKYFDNNTNSKKYILVAADNDIENDFNSKSKENVKVFCSNGDIGFEDFISSLSDNNEEDNKEKKVFQKGEAIDFKGIYSDYENDPSKASYYLYYHFPFNDGENSEVNYIINESFSVKKVINDKAMTEPIVRFYKDGMYKVQHWQYDDTGNSEYDKMSNVAEMVFYIQGSASDTSVNIAPLIENISTIPEKPVPGKSLDVEISFDDEDKDALELYIDIYKDGVLMKENSELNILPDAKGNYSPLTIHVSDNAEFGKYSVIAKLTDGTYTSVKEYSFSIISDYKISGTVNHTEQWDKNRKKYNLSLFNNEFNLISDFNSYRIMAKPRKRGTNVFWSEEKFIINALATGNPEKMIVNLKGTEYSSELKDSGEDDSLGNNIYSGELWNSNIKGKWGKAFPNEAIFVISAYYSGGIVQSFESKVIIDDTDSYWRVHQLH